MVLRLMEIILPSSEVNLPQLNSLLEDHEILGYWEVGLTEELILVRVLLPAIETESLLDKIEDAFGGLEGFRIFIINVKATLPRVNSNNNPAEEMAEEIEDEKKVERVSREELYSSISQLMDSPLIFSVLMILASLVAAIGALKDNVAVIIGAMIIAPMLSPNVGFALSTVLSDKDLARKSIYFNALGIFIGFIIAFIIGLMVPVDPTVPSISIRSDLAMGSVVLAFASGVAGSLAFTTALSSILIGVMISVALLPPLVIVGLLAGAGYYDLAGGAGLLFITNLVGVNFAAVLTFWVQKIKPLDKEEAKSARKYTYGALIAWGVILFALLMLVFARNLI
ncbi:TIGR00341 family protein [Methanobacterium alkalithermotolerans]|uniref:TIGR00341 family protein n=1 Tax=Methanobacterium alkalithermotolerans TaxID=2731220 RepID=A0A8T8K2Q0_9EURY|nr:TIGR00341 family protein [Methanobacterium alkalithermotolerans]QUH22654.1 TIGR00341 family protein [Methanobacterium alkalithermotolerans]